MSTSKPQKGVEDKKLYLVRSVNQKTGEDLIAYYLAHGLEHLEDEIVDIVQIQPLTDFEDLTLSKNSN